MARSGLFEWSTMKTGKEREKDKSGQGEESQCRNAGLPAPAVELRVLSEPNRGLSWSPGSSFQPRGTINTRHEMD